MKKNLRKNYSETAGVKWVLFFAILVTLYFNPAFADPFNSAKLYVLLIASLFLIAFFSTSVKPISIKFTELRNLIKFLSLFNITYLVLLPVNQNLFNFFLGENQRSIGFLAYFSFSVFMLLAAFYFQSIHQKYLYYSAILLGIIYLIYGQIQISGNDFVRWNNPYNSIIGTLGNPNFAAAFMAMILTLIFGFTFSNKISFKLKIINILVISGLAYNIYLSDARQGILSAILGMSFFLLVYIYKHNKILGISNLIIFIFSGLLIILGMLQMGPLSKILYKDSISLRGYYWRAGLNMFFDKPFTGVGIERYGTFFKMYRDPNYPLKYGYELISTNAHNVYIQFFATGGVALGLIYFAINFYIFKKGIDGILNSSLKEFVLLTTIFSSWLAFQAQSLISIDNSGLTVWGWILGGVIVGLSYEINRSHENLDNKTSFRKKIYFNSFVPTLVVMFSFTIVLFLSRSESNMFLTRANYNPENKNNLVAFQTLAGKVINDPFAALNYKLEASNYLIQIGLENEGLQQLKKIVNTDPVNPLFLNSLASMFEYKGSYLDSIKVREKILIYDPQNINNMLQLARLYSNTQNNAKAIQMKNLIKQFSPLSEQAKTVDKEISS